MCAATAARVSRGCTLQTIDHPHIWRITSTNAGAIEMLSADTPPLTLPRPGPRAPSPERADNAPPAVSAAHASSLADAAPTSLLRASIPGPGRGMSPVARSHLASCLRLRTTRARVRAAASSEMHPSSTGLMQLIPATRHLSRFRTTGMPPTTSLRCTTLNLRLVERNHLR